MNISIMKLFAFFIGIISQILFYPKSFSGKCYAKLHHELAWFCFAHFRFI